MPKPVTVNAPNPETPAENAARNVQAAIEKNAAALESCGNGPQPRRLVTMHPCAPVEVDAATYERLREALNGRLIAAAALYADRLVAVTYPCGQTLDIPLPRAGAVEEVDEPAQELAETPSQDQ